MFILSFNLLTTIRIEKAFSIQLLSARSFSTSVRQRIEWSCILQRFADEAF